MHTLGLAVLFIVHSKQERLPAAHFRKNKQLKQSDTRELQQNKSHDQRANNSTQLDQTSIRGQPNYNNNDHFNRTLVEKSVRTKLASMVRVGACVRTYVYRWSGSLIFRQPEFPVAKQLWENQRSKQKEK